MSLDRALADLVVVLHLGFVLWVVFGGLAVLRWRRVGGLHLAWLHLPAAVWGALVELAGWYCPLTDVENALRRRAGAAGYEGGFVEHYLLPVLYPPGLSRGVQLALGLGVLVINGAIYGLLWWRRRSEAAR